MFNRHNVQEGDAAILELVRGLALEDVEVVCRGGEGNGSTAPENCQGEGFMELLIRERSVQYS